ncbi:D-(-)-3-hydroxybutyrate oligomer hydrolase [Niveibacterium umoris]|uniref:Hydroxybutyrate-dimer hydrolase n=1 Tax=Niveibacterium umoris TaxID=1193620 RepID=A0A840BJ19_9RHOO|nr:D-(-)-3-hydroxybutyrate oligomer hydrolase [Niveibacterium umoris]MBB4013541.1 hydroxybutyrate-dimer hydrolase [Niveibacterium umoris]
MHHTRYTVAGACICAALAGCGTDHYTPQEDLNTRPAWLSASVTRADYDGASDDLLTAGLGVSGLKLATAPAIADPANPTSAELRRLAIYTNYRALVDITVNGGFSRLYGPNIDLTGNDTLGEGKIAGTEYLAYTDDGSGHDNVALMVQVPASFDAKSPCIVTATSSGSRGVYGAISAAGEWGLKRGCAVAYTDKGSGNGAHELDSNTVTLLDGRLTKADVAGKNAHFAADLTDAARQAFSTTNPFRYAFKHAHSQRNPEKDWGRYTLNAVEFAFWVLNERYGTPATYTPGALVRTVVPSNTLVIAASVSNGGGAAIAAAEQDTAGLIDAVVVGEPQLYPPAPAGMVIQQGATVQPVTGLPLYDYFTYANLLQPCAAQAPSNASQPYGVTVLATQAANRCAALAGAGLVTGATTAEQAEDAKLRLRAYGWLPDSDLLHASHFGLNATMGVALTYANAYAKASVTDMLCGYSFATTNASGVPTAPATSPMAKIFGLGNGVPPTSGINVVTALASNGPINYTLAASPSTGKADYDFDGAQCLRKLLTTNATVQKSVGEIRRSADLHGKPALIVHGRSDALVPVNHSSRAYYAANQIVEGAKSGLHYIEVTNANHFDAFLSVPGYDTRLIPLHYYGQQALNAMWAHLKQGAALPPSQVVRTTPRGGSPGAAPAIASSNLPPIQASPAAADAITVAGKTLTVPD